MRFEWDEAKNQSNLEKHGIDFPLACEVFEDPHLHLEHSRVRDNEDRWQAIGMLGYQLMILVAHSYRYNDGEIIVRLISARRASRKERKRYEETKL